MGMELLNNPKGERSGGQALEKEGGTVEACVRHQRKRVRGRLTLGKTADV